MNPSLAFLNVEVVGQWPPANIPNDGMK
jgi:hypothetical protein